MKSLRLLLAERWTAILLATQLLLPLLSHAQDIPDETFSLDQQRAGAEVFITKHEQVLSEVRELALELEHKHEAMLYRLSTQRIADYKAALNLPDRNPLEKRRKASALSDFSDMDYARAMNPDEAYLNELGESVYYKRVIKGERIGEFEIAIPGLGRAEPTSIDGRVYTRIVHDGTGAKFLIVDEALDLESKHLKQYIARVNTLANLGQGRPLVLIIFNRTEIDPASATHGTVRYRYYAKPTTRKAKLQAWWTANYVAPDRGAVMLTAMSVMFSAGFTEGIEGLKFLMNHSYVWSHNATMLSSAFGTVFGLWGSFYNNITSARDPLNPQSRFKATAARMLISSATFAYSMQIMNHGVASLTLMTNAGWLNHGRIWMNNIANNLVKDQFKKFNDLREDMGLSRGNIRVLGVDMKRNQLERQVWYQPPNMLKILDLTRFEAAGIPVGSLAFYSSYVWTQYLLYRYAESLNYSKKDVIRNNWNALIRKPVTLLQQGVSLLKQAATATQVYGGYLSEGVKEMIASNGSYLKSGWELLAGDYDRCARLFRGEAATGATSPLEDAGFVPDSEGWIEIKN